MSSQQSLEDEVREDVCGTVARAVLASTGDACMRRDVETVGGRLDRIRGVRVDRVRNAEEQNDNRDFIDLTISRASSSGQMFLILTRNGFVPEAMAGNWEGGTPQGEDGRVVLQWKR